MERKTSVTAGSPCLSLLPQLFYSFLNNSDDDDAEIVIATAHSAHLF